MEGFMPNVADVGGWGLFVALVFVIIFAVIKGALVPIATVRQMQEVFNQEIMREKERADGYRESSENYRELLQKVTEAQVLASGQQIETNTRVLEALQKAGEDSDHV